MASAIQSIGVDLGGTKVATALVDEEGRVHKLIRQPTDVEGGPGAVERQIVSAVKELAESRGASPVGVGLGVAGQIKAGSGEVLFAPNLNWRNVPLESNLSEALGLPVVVTNDVRAITWGEWWFGAGKGTADIVCVFAGTGIGGGIVTGGRMMVGCGNTAGEIGHMTVSINGPTCTCGNDGCMEAVAGGWAIARRAREAVAADRSAGESLLKLVGNAEEEITARIVAKAFHMGDPLARQIIEEAAQALIAGSITLVNAFNPCRLILGGGVIDGLPELRQRIEHGVRMRALKAATEVLEVVPAKLGSDAGVIGAAALAMEMFSGKGRAVRFESPP